jgi:hypothetical protein
VPRRFHDAALAIGIGPRWRFNDTTGISFATLISGLSLFMARNTSRRT